MKVRPGFQFSGVVTLLLVPLVAVAVIALVVSGLAAPRASHTREAWNATFGSYEEVMQRYPPAEANESALELEPLAAAIGVDLSPRSAERGPESKPSKRRREAFDKVKFELFGHYDKAQLERAQLGDVAAPPPVLREYLSENAPALDALRRHLITRETPIWESDLSRLHAAPMPNLLGQINLYKLFMNIGLERLHAGDRAGALRNVEASYRLGRSLASSPVLINQLVAIVGVRMQLAVLRQIPDFPAVWLERLETQDHRGSLLTALKFAGWHWVHDESVIRDDESRWWNRIVAPIKRPYTRLCLADLSGRWRKQVEQLERLTILCDRDLSVAGANFDIPLPRWNRVGELLIPNLGGVVERLARLEVDIEMTRLLFEAAAARRANGGRWPAMPRERPSLVCPHDSWTFAPSAEGLRIAFSREISWPDQRGIILPTRALIPTGL